MVASGDASEQVARRLAAFAEWCEKVIAKAGLSIIVLGPAPCPIERIQGRFRHHLILKGPPQALGRWIRAVAPRLGTMRDGVRLAVDRDPVTLL